MRITIKEVIDHCHIGHGIIFMDEREDGTIHVWCDNFYCDWQAGTRELIEDDQP